MPWPPPRHRNGVLFATLYCTTAAAVVLYKWLGFVWGSIAVVGVAALLLVWVRPSLPPRSIDRHPIVRSAVPPRQTEHAWSALAIVFGVLSILGLALQLVGIAAGDVGILAGVAGLVFWSLVSFWITAGAWRRSAWGRVTH
jgi:hypothetical protein